MVGCDQMCATIKRAGVTMGANKGGSGATKKGFEILKGCR